MVAENCQSKNSHIEGIIFYFHLQPFSTFFLISILIQKKSESKIKWNQNKAKWNQSKMIWKMILCSYTLYVTKKPDEFLPC